jgi:uncharacterized protein YhdP
MVCWNTTRWPRIEALATEIRFEGREMTLHAARGRTLEGIEILDTTARIADLGATQNHVQIHGHARGPATKARDFIQHSPLKETVGQRIEPLTADGNFALELGLKIPFADVKKTRIEGTVILPANTVTVKGIGLKFTQLRGSLVFTEETLTGKGLEAQLFNRPVRIDIESTKDDAWVRLKGKADRAFLAERLAARGVSRLFERVKGETDWQAKLDLTRPWNDPAGGENLEIRSSLIGLQIDAPAPLGKAYLGEPRPFILKTSLAHAPARWVTLEYGEIFKAKLMLAGQSSSSLRQASIQLGRRTMRPTNSARLWIGGRLEEFSLSQWTDFLDTVGPLLSSNPPAPHKLSPIGMDIVVSRLEGFGNWFNNIRLIADNALGTWRFKIDGKDAAGMIHVPSAKYVKAKLTRLILAHPATDTPTIAIEPARFPAVSVNCDRFVLKSFDLGKMALSMRPHPSGLRLESLTLTSPTIHIKAQGDWQSASGIPMSRFDISAQGPDLRGLLRRFNL